MKAEAITSIGWSTYSCQLNSWLRYRTCSCIAGLGFESCTVLDLDSSFQDGLFTPLTSRHLNYRKGGTVEKISAWKVLCLMEMQVWLQFMQGMVHSKAIKRFDRNEKSSTKSGKELENCSLTSQIGFRKDINRINERSLSQPYDISSASSEGGTSIHTVLASFLSLLVFISVIFSLFNHFSIKTQ